MRPRCARLGTILDTQSRVRPGRSPGCCYTFCVRQLIVNADDFGLTTGVNRAIVETHKGGIVSSTTLMANGAAFDDAVERVRAVPTLSVGCHVVLVDGTPVSAPDAVDTLLAIRSAEPEKFHSRLSAVAARAVFGGFDPDQLVEEITAQIRAIQSASLGVTHLDTHKHTHVFPEILGALLRAARICGVPALRNPFVPVAAVSARGFTGKPRLLTRYSQVRMLRSFARQFRVKVRRAGLMTPDGVVGVVETGSLNPSLLRQTLTNLPDGTWELVCHPGYDDADLRAARTRLIDSRDQERRLLMSEDLRTFLDERKIRVIGYREFVGSRN
jgi:hopanoid biosynthesis associated protein HpnK